MEARSITLEELLPHTEQARVTDPALVPVSPLRLQSYLHNPRAQLTDHVLFEMRENGRLIAYRTVLPDSLYGERGEPHRFAWLSGNYVLPEYRRKGISTALLQQVEARWEGQLMYTNYAPASKAVYDRTGQFRLLRKREGTRFYLRAASAELLKARLGESRILKTGDQLVNLFVNKRLKGFDLSSGSEDNLWYEAVGEGNYTVTRLTVLDPPMATLIEKHNKQNLFRRDAGIFQWILDFPWVTAGDADPVPYHFSYRSEQFQNLLYKLESEHGKQLGLLWLLIHDRKLSIPYLFMDDEKLLRPMARVCMETIIRSELAHATVRHEGLRRELKLYRKWFLSLRDMPQLIFAHRLIQESIPREFTVHDGDGDVVFTG
jgi:GNAT superfamily N-acetyltransferase